MVSRRWRRILIGLVVLIIAGAVVLVLTARPRLEDDRNAVDDTWVPLRAPLNDRYDALAAVDEQLRAAGGEDRDVTAELTEELDRWQDAADAPDDDADAETEVEIANTLEGLSVLVLANVNASERLRSSVGLTESLAAFAATAPDPMRVTSYNDAVDSYEDARDSLLRRPVADILGYESRTELVLAG
jgi:hypothetical protein